MACASNPGKLRVTEAVSELLHVLYIDSYPQSRREMGLSLARLLDAEGNYIELSRTIYEDPGTALAQEMDVVRSILSRQYAERDDILPLLLESREHFARGQLEQGFRLLLRVIDFLAGEEIPLACRQILVEAGIRMRESGQSRLEYLILAIVAFENSIP